MKNKFHLASLAVIVALVFSLISCSKDKIEPAGGNSGSGSFQAKSTTNIPDQPPVDMDVAAPGSLQLQVFPAETKSYVTVYNEEFNSGQIPVNAIQGILRMENLKPGIYQVSVNPSIPGYLPVLIENVVINTDSKTNLGIIVLGN